jgi:autotransporter-associated beta strand protein
VDSGDIDGLSATSLDTLLTAIYGGTSTAQGLQAGAILGLDTSTATGGSFTLGNAITDSTGTGGGSLGLTKLGTGTLLLSADNTFSGETRISAGTLILPSPLTLQNSALNTLDSIVATATAGLKTDQTTLTFGGLTGNKDLSTVFETTSGGYSGLTALTLNPGTGATPSYSGIINDGAVGMTLTKTGDGTQLLSGANTYTGTTTVSAGTLLVNSPGSLAGGAVAVNGTSTLGGNGTIGGTVTVAAAANLAPGASVGTLSIGGGLNISALAGGAGKLFYELGSIAASDKIAVSGTLDIGGGLLGFSDFDFSNVGGLQTGTYTLITSGTLTGTLDAANLVGTIGTSEATLQINGNNIELAVAGPPPTTTLVIDLGAGTQIPGGAFGTFGALNLPIPPLPTGSILRSLEVNAVLQITDNDNFASDLAVLFDPTPGTPGGDFSVIMTNGAIKFGAPVQLGWPAAANFGPPTPVVDTKEADDWAAAGTIDLATTGIFLGNTYDDDTNESVEGGTWSGTITLTYDMVGAGTPYENWAGGALFDGDENGDGVSNGLAFLLGAAGPNVNALGLLPTVTKSAGGLVLTFDMLDAASRGSATLSIEHSSDLGIVDAWEAALVPDTDQTVNDVVFDIEGSGTLDVEATIPSSKAAAGKLFGRLKAVYP